MYPSDFPRRSRHYDHASLKAHEWRQLGLFAFPLIVRCLPKSKGNEKSVFMAFGFLNRAMRMPEEEYRGIPEAFLLEAMEILNGAYEAAYGRTANSYNYHIVASHLMDIRDKMNGPLTKYTAYPFEGSYGELRRAFMAGTRKFT